MTIYEFELEIDGESVTVRTSTPINQFTKQMVQDIYAAGRQYVEQNLKPLRQEEEGHDTGN